jgi:hypothetical protein
MRASCCAGPNTADMHAQSVKARARASERPHTDAHTAKTAQRPHQDLHTTRLHPRPHACARQQPTRKALAPRLQAQYACRAYTHRSCRRCALEATHTRGNCALEATHTSGNCALEATHTTHTGVAGGVQESLEVRREGSGKEVEQGLSSPPSLQCASPPRFSSSRLVFPRALSLLSLCPCALCHAERPGERRE